MRAAPRRRLCGGLVALLWLARAAAADATPEDLSALLEPIRAQQGVPALAGAILEGGRVTGLGATGVRRRGAKTPVTPGDRWHLGSCTKAMTATVLARLVARGALRWDTTPASLTEGLRPAYRSVTLTQLLQHRAGVPADLAALPIWGWLRSHAGDARSERLALARFLLEREPEVAPGTQYLYANGGYAIAGAIAEQATGTDWETLVRTELFEPLGMRSAGFGAPRGEGRLDEPWGHRQDGEPVPPGPGADNPPALAPAATVHATLEDWARFAALHLAAYGGEPKLLTRETLRALHTPPAGEGYAYGWLVVERPWADGVALSHTGSNTMWTATIWLAPKRGFGVLTATNQGGDAAGQAVDQAAGALIEHRLAADRRVSGLGP